MNELEIQLMTILRDIREQVIQLVNQNQINNAELFMEQYIKLSPSNIERYSLEAMIRNAQGDLEGAEMILKEGLALHPLSFDLLYNLGFIFERKEEVLAAYDFYMKARYISEKDEEREDIASALTRVGKNFSGGESSNKNEISTVVVAGGLKMTLTTKIDELLRRQKLLKSIEGNIAKNISSVLEIGFEDGIISKNLNYFGYDVTAVSPRKEDILNIITKEWHDNLLQPKQKVAKFYHEEININWVEQIPRFDIIIAVGNGNLNTFANSDKEGKKLLELLLKKAKNQLFIRVSLEPSSIEFSKKDLLEIIKVDDLQLSVIYSIKNEKGEKFELCLVSKVEELTPFSVPRGLESEASKSTIIEVDVNRCTDFYGASYIDDWQHFVEVLKEYEENPKLEYRESVLKAYYERFLPRNLGESLFPYGTQAPKLRKGWIGYPWYWDKSQRLIFEKKSAETRKGGNHHFGSNTEEFAQDEFRRLISLYDYIKKDGYHPEMFSDGYISGYILTKDEDYRFIVTEGQHRMACLAALGYETIRCRFTQSPEYPKSVDFHDMKKWPQVENGVYSRSLAAMVFNRFFEEDVGRDRMFSK